MSTDKNAIEQAERLVLAAPANVQHCYSLVKLYKQSRDWKLLSTYFQDDSKQKTLLSNAFYNAAYITKQRGEYHLAIDYYRLALDFNIERPEEVYINLAVIYSESLRKEGKAIAMLEKALTINSKFLPALYNLAGLYEETGNKASAVEYYQRILILEPLEPDVLVRLATCLNRDEVKGLINPLKEALTLPSLTLDQKINLNYALGKVLDDCKEYQYAFKVYQEANNLDAKTMAKYIPEVQEQYTNDNIALFSKNWFNKLPIISTARPIFICGMFRSGSTLLEQVLSAHKEITAGGEVDYFDNFINKMSFTYPEGVDTFSIEQLTKLSTDYLDTVKEMFPEASLLTDKRPDNFLYVGLIKSLFPNALIIHTQRNMNDNCLAIYFQRLDSNLTYATHLPHIKHYYHEQQRLMSHWKDIFPESFHIVNYEDLVSYPEQNTKTIFSSLNLEWQEQCHKFYLNKNNVKTASVWQVRQPLHGGSCERWLNYEKEITCAIM